MKKNMGYIIAIMAIAVLLISSGCVSNKSVTTPTPAPTITTTPMTPTMPPTVAPTTAEATKTPETVEVEIIGFAFVPATITISRGTTVQWTQKDSVTHTVTGTGFDSGGLSQGKTFSHTFNDAGTFDYGCSIHTSMTGKIIVT